MFHWRRRPQRPFQGTSFWAIRTVSRYSWSSCKYISLWDADSREFPFSAVLHSFTHLHFKIPKMICNPLNLSSNLRFFLSILCDLLVTYLVSPAEARASPVRLVCCSPKLLEDSIHRDFSPADFRENSHQRRKIRTDHHDHHKPLHGKSPHLFMAPV